MKNMKSLSKDKYPSSAHPELVEGLYFLMSGRGDMVLESGGSRLLVIKFLLFSAFFIFTICFASKNEEAFLGANKLYSEKKYKEALNLYKSIEKKGPVTFYNMGNCEFKLENHVGAIICWHKAKKFASYPMLSDIRYNIELGYEKLGISQDKNSWQEVKDYINLFSLFSLQTMFLFFWFLFFGFFIFLKKLRVVFLTTTLLVNLVLASVLSVKYNSRNYPTAIAKSTVEVFVGPNEQYHQVGKISAVDKVVVQKIDKKWYKVNRNGVAGWVLSDKLEII